MRAQLIAVIILIGIIPMLIFTGVITSSYEEKATDQRISELQNHGTIIANQLISTGYLTNQDIPDVNVEVKQIADIYEGRIIIIDKNLNIIKDTYSLEEKRTIISESVIKCFKGTNSVIKNNVKNYVELTLPVNHKDTKEVIGVMIISFSTKGIDSVLTTLEQQARVFGLTFGIVIVAFALYYSTKLTKPFKRVRNSLDQITEGYMDEEISLSGYTEMEAISNSFNKMMERIQKLESSRQEFVSNVSHELKTPITSIKVLADSLLAQEEAPVELYKEFFTDIRDEVEREDKIITDLLSLVKLDKTSGELHISGININDLLEQILKRLRPIAAKRNIELVYESFRPVIAEVDEVKLSLAINNLIENAIKYNVEDGWVRVSLNADHKFFFIKVSDSGIGIPEESQEFIFERFYRVDKARTRETGGTGLGLSITRNAILLHRGAIKVYSKENEGTTFTVRVPLNYIA